MVQILLPTIFLQQTEEEEDLVHQVTAGQDLETIGKGEQDQNQEIKREGQRGQGQEIV